MLSVLARCWVVCIGLPLLGLSISASAAEFQIAAAPSWVRPVELGTVQEKLRAQASDGAYYLLADVQVRSVRGDRVRFHHYATQALTAPAVESIANIEIGFDPAFEGLTLHAVDVIRDGKRIHKLKASAVRILQRETELEALIYDGSKSASLFMDDVRVNDIVEYSYSLRGRNPVFGKAEFGSFRLQYGTPVARIYSRLLVADDQPLTIARRHTRLAPIIQTEGELRSYLWDARNVPAMTIDDGAPSWYDPVPAVQWSDYQDWGAVARWAQPLYELPEILPAALDQEIARIQSAHASDAERAIAVLRWVQAEIRYLGIEIGAGSHAPSPPELVYQRRFGDCKDKALLTMAMLRRMGIEARAALVNTDLRRGLLQIHPSPGAFDHVIVRVSLAGRHYWLDPTRSPQKGDLTHVYQPNYDQALVIDPSTTKLTPMARPAADIGRRQVTMLVDASAGFDEPVPLTVTTVVEGDRAESLRQTLNGNSPDELEKQFLNYYASYYSDIRSGGPMTVKDDADNNRITTTEHYLIEKMSKWYEADQQYAVNLHAPDIDDLITDPSTPIRTAPLALSHPLDVSVRTEVRLPSEWPIEPESSKVEDPAFLLERHIELSERNLIIRDRFRTRLDEISAADTPRYVANLERARAELRYSLWWTKAKTEAPAAKPRWIDQLNWSVALLGLSVLALCLIAARRLYRYDPAPHIDPRHAHLSSIRGWLLFPALATVIGPLVILHTLYEGAGAYTTDTWVKLTTFGQAAYHPAWAPALLTEFIGNLMLLVAALLILVLFFQRRSSVPRLFVAYMLLRAAVVIGATALSAKIPEVGKSSPEEAFSVVGVVFGSALWIAYFLASHRVRATFVRRLAPVTPSALAPPPPADDAPAAAASEPAVREPTKAEPAIPEPAVLESAEPESATPDPSAPEPASGTTD